MLKGLQNEQENILDLQCFLNVLTNIFHDHMPPLEHKPWVVACVMWQQEKMEQHNPFERETFCKNLLHKDVILLI